MASKERRERSDRIVRFGVFDKTVTPEETAAKIKALYERYRDDRQKSPEPDEQ